MTITRTFIPDPAPSEHAQASASAVGSNLPADDPVWAAARRSYLAGCSTPVVAERHGLHERTVRRRAAQEGWGEIRRRMGEVEAKRRRSAMRAGDPPSPEEALRQRPELEDFVDAHSYEVGELLLRPQPDRLSRFAFRRAAEMAAQGRPQEAGAWLRLVTATARVADRLHADAQPFSLADHMRARYAADLRRAFEGDPADQEEAEAEEPEEA